LWRAVKLSHVRRRAVASAARSVIVALWPLVTLMALVVVVTFLGSLGGPVLKQVVVNALVNLTIVVGLYIFVGNSGVFSFGQISFMAIGAYAGSILAMSSFDKEISLPALPHFLATTHLPTIPATILAGVVAAVVAAVIAFPLMRLSGIGASIATFSMLVIVYVVASNWNALTGGSGGIIGAPTTTTRDYALIWALVAMAIAYAFQRSSIGLRLKASREDEFAARSVGVTIYLERRLAFTLSAFVVGIGGALFASLFGSFAPSAFYLDITFLTAAMLVVGGRTSLAGAVVGTLFLAAIAEILRRVEEGIDLGLFDISVRPGVQQLGVGLVMLLVLLVRPRGLTNGRELEWRTTTRAIRAVRTLRPSRTAHEPAPDTRQ
jgi:branched-chain amino acid transport system permease protein